MDCPVVTAIRELRGGWDKWDDEEQGVIKVAGVEYVCTEARFYITIRKMEFARRTLAGTLNKEQFFKLMLTGKAGEVLPDMILRGLYAKFEIAMAAVWRSLSHVNGAVITAAYKGKIAPALPIFEPGYDATPIELVNQCVEHVNKYPNINMTPLPAASVNSNKPATISAGMDAAAIMLAEEEIVRGIGRMEVEYVAAINKTSDVVAACKKIIEELLK